MDGNILTLFKILFFGGSTLLTPEPIDIGISPFTVELDPAVKAITKDASVNIDVSQYIDAGHATDGFREIEQKFPQGCIKVTLVSDQGRRVVLDQRSGRWGGVKRMVNLVSADGVPTRTRFSAMELSACTEIMNAEVTWFNYGKK